MDIRDLTLTDKMGDSAVRNGGFRNPKAAPGYVRRIELPAGPCDGASSDVWMGYYAAVECYYDVGRAAYGEGFQPPQGPHSGSRADKFAEDSVWLTYYIVYIGYCDEFSGNIGLTNFQARCQESLLALRCGADDGYCYMGLADSKVAAGEMRVLGKDPFVANILSTPDKWYRSFDGWYVTTNGSDTCHVSLDRGPGSISARRFFYYAASLSKHWPPGSLGEALLLGHLGRSLLPFAVSELSEATGDMVVLEDVPAALPPDTVVVCENRRDVVPLAGKYSNCEVIHVGDLRGNKVKDAFYYTSAMPHLTDEQYKEISDAVVRSLVVYIAATDPPYAFRNRSAKFDPGTRRRMAAGAATGMGPLFGRRDAGTDPQMMLDRGVLGYRYALPRDFASRINSIVAAGADPVGLQEGCSYALLLRRTFADVAVRQLGRGPSIEAFARLPAEWLQVETVFLMYNRGRIKVQPQVGTSYCPYPLATVQLARACAGVEWFPGSIGRAFSELQFREVFLPSSSEVTLELKFA